MLEEKSPNVNALVFFIQVLAENKVEIDFRFWPLATLLPGNIQLTPVSQHMKTHNKIPQMLPLTECQKETGVSCGYLPSVVSYVETDVAKWSILDVFFCKAKPLSAHEVVFVTWLVTTEGLHP